MKNQEIRNAIRKILFESEVNDEKVVGRLKNNNPETTPGQSELELLKEPLKKESELVIERKRIFIKDLIPDN